MSCHNRIQKADPRDLDPEHRVIYQRELTHKKISEMRERHLDLPQYGYPNSFKFVCKQGKFIRPGDKNIPLHLLMAGDKVMAPATFKLYIDYPLSNPVSIDIKEPAPITKKRFAEIVCEQYVRIYNEESATTTTPIGYIPGTCNRNITDGTHGIWGHVIEDLVVFGAYVNDGIYRLVMGS